MGFRRNQPQLTGADYVLVMAHEAAEQEQPFAHEFEQMITAAFGGGLLVTEMVAQRPLKEHEASPVSIILRAAELAMERRDHEALREVLQVGMSLLAKWSSYLVMRDEHPDFTWKTEDEED